MKNVPNIYYVKITLIIIPGYSRIPRKNTVINDTFVQSFLKIIGKRISPKVKEQNVLKVYFEKSTEYNKIYKIR